jgi:DNA-binding MarR family transcriptional regulator
MFLVKDLPKYEVIRARAARYPEIDPDAVEAFLILMRTGSDVLMGVEKFLARHKLSHGGFCVLMVLYRQPKVGLNPSDLASRCGVTRATMTGLLDCLQRNKLIRRESDQADRRTVLVRLNDHGVVILESLLHDYYRRVALLMAGLSNPDKKHLNWMLGQVALGVEHMVKPST